MPTPVPAPPPTPLPTLDIVGADNIVIEATVDTQFAYHDEGAKCTDDGTDISVRVSVVGTVAFPNVGMCQLSPIEYHCVNAQGVAAIPITRTVKVEDRTCPTCVINAGPTQIEAGFAYNDPGATCTDSLDGACAATGKACYFEVSSDVNVDQVGTYSVTYRARDHANNWNDQECIGHAEYKRTVIVVDTLKPVIALHYGSNLVHMGQASDTAIHNNAPNPAGNHWSPETLMAEATSEPAGWMLGGAASVVAGLALVALDQRRRAAAQDLPL
jgi:hypothetical protein